ncbi:MAG: hypothetical protein A3B37_00950 [Candidatus Sungbacteria bacterium RIFCSPLOWO2_01_FULL_59_16]|uniref:Isoleucine--tRNA ligase n=1 Tax=Candidatus Sungbacteria bacterium RIFCSPLOWO2_01_FULL_59_16 TaxID=1802280 RepID=A0A1G2LBS9_9BACT|nr:MAG: hypothetical protein A3B37_00950 [Candidatus Sungbacteria bacterium RIFCSPLOWO2_01_FULL_59_16]
MRENERQLNLPKREEKILEFWERNRIFEKTLQKTRGGRPFIFYEGPPTANAAPGIHHVEARSFKDVIPRYQTMRGRYVERKAGWDTHGLPVEIQVEKALGLKSKRDIEKFGIAEFNAKAKESVWKFKEEWERLTKRIGFWLDLKRPYITYEASYIETLWWIIKEIWKQKLLYRDFKVVPWCPRCETALSTHELGLGYETVKDRSVYVRFRVTSKDRRFAKTAILSWTTTPWTLPGNVALAVNPDGEYVVIPDPDIKGQWLILGKEPWRNLVEKGVFPPEYRSQLMLDDIETIKGKALVGLGYGPLFAVAELRSPKSHRVYAADFVTMEEGTGVVHTAVMYGEDDYKLGTKVGLPKFHTVTETGRFGKTIGEGLGGLFVKDKKTEEKIVASLKNRGLLFRDELYEHDYPFCWRCSTPVLYYARDAWWIKVSAKRKALIANNEKVHWVPEHLKRGRFGEFLREVRDWAFSRERYWGTPLPVWQCTKCKHGEVVGSFDELDRLSKKSGNRYFAMRHGEAETQLLQVNSAARNKYHLTPRGRGEVEERAAKLKGKVDLIIASPVLRAKESAAVISKIIRVRTVTDARLSEISFGELDDTPFGTYDRFFTNDRERFTRASKGGETLSDVRRRVTALAEELERKHKNRRILFVSHADPIWMLSAAAKGLSDEEALTYHPEQGDFLRTGAVVEIPWKNLPRDSTGMVNPHRPFVDSFELVCPKCRGRMRRVSEVVDVWFDSGAMPFAQYHFPFAQGRKTKGKSVLPFPADYICEAVDQTRGWFYTLLAVSTLLGRGPSYKNVISLGHVLDKNGQKMSKSKGNIVDPWAMIGKYGADAIRWYFYTVNAPGDPKRFDEKDLLLKLRGPIATLWNSFVFFDTYVDKIPNSKSQSLNNKFQIPKSKNVLDQWVLAMLNQRTADVTKRLDTYDVVGAARSLEDFIVNDFSNWYLRRSRRRFQRPESEKEKHDAAAVTAFALLRLVELMAPFTPFLAENIYQELRKKLGLREESVHLRSWPRVKTKDEGQKTKALVEGMAEARRIAALALAERAKSGIRVRQPLAELKVSAEGGSAFGGKSSALMDILKDEVNVKEVVVDARLAGEVELDTAITAELHEEGVIRELVRHVQEMRRDGGLKPQQGVRLQVLGDREITVLVDRWQKFIKKEAGVRVIQLGGRGSFTVEREVKLNERMAWVGISRVGRRVSKFGVDLT